MSRKRRKQEAAAPQDRQPPPASPPREEAREFTELVLVAHANNLSEAELYKTELQARGIPAILEGEGAGVAGIPDVGAGVPVLVPEGMADEAAELIAELESTKTEGHPLNAKEEIFDEDTEDLDELDELDGGSLDDDEDPEKKDDDTDDEDDEDEDDDEWEDDDEDDEEESDDDEEWDDDDD